MEDLEEKYAEDIEKEEEIFLEGLQNKKTLGELEKEYSKKVKEIRRVYEKLLKKDLNDEKEKEIKNVKNKIKNTESNEKEFHVKNLRLEENWLDKKQIEISSWRYKNKRKISNFFGIIMPNYLIYFYYKTKRIFNDIFKDARNIFENIWEKISGIISDALSSIKGGVIKIISSIKKVINGLSFIKRGFIKVMSDMKKIINLLVKNKENGEKKDKEENANKESKK
jgi:hypothetical protein